VCCSLNGRSETALQGAAWLAESVGNKECCVHCTAAAAVEVVVAAVLNMLLLLLLLLR
jgi:hypothetical protein